MNRLGEKMKNIIYKIDAKLYMAKSKIIEKLTVKANGFTTVEVAILVLIGIVLASIFYKYIRDIVNNIMSGAQSKSDTLYQ